MKHLDLDNLSLLFTTVLFTNEILQKFRSGHGGRAVVEKLKDLLHTRLSKALQKYGDLETTDMQEVWKSVFNKVIHIDDLDQVKD